MHVQMVAMVVGTPKPRPTPRAIWSDRFHSPPFPMLPPPLLPPGLAGWVGPGTVVVEEMVATTRDGVVNCVIVAGPAAARGALQQRSTGEKDDVRIKEARGRRRQRGRRSR